MIRTPTMIQNPTFCSNQQWFKIQQFVIQAMQHPAIHPSQRMHPPGSESNKSQIRLQQWAWGRGQAWWGGGRRGLRAKSKRRRSKRRVQSPRARRSEGSRKRLRRGVRGPDCVCREERGVQKDENILFQHATLFDLGVI